MTKPILIITLALLTVSSFAQVKKPVTTATKPAAKPATAIVNPLKNNADSVSYSVGLRIAQSLKSQGFDNINMSLFTKAMSDLKQNKPALLNDQAITQCLGTFQQKVNEAKMKENESKSVGAKKEGAAFLAANGKRAGVVTLPSGMQYEVLKAGTGNTKPTLANTVKCHYTVTPGNFFKRSSTTAFGCVLKFSVLNSTVSLLMVTGARRAVTVTLPELSTSVISIFPILICSPSVFTSTNFQTGT